MKNEKFSIFLLISLLIVTSLFSTSCSLYQVNSQDTTLDYYPPKAAVHDVTYVETPQRPYKIIGMISVNAERNQKLSEVIQKMKQEAAILGGDAITNITSKSGSEKWTEGKLKNLLQNAYIRTDFVADVIIYE